MTLPFDPLGFPVVNVLTLPPSMAADAGNSHALANIGIGGVFTGAWTARDSANSIWLEYAAVAASAAQGLVIEQSNLGVVADESESWSVAAGASGRFPTPLRRAYYRVTYTQGAAAGNVTLAVTRDVAAVDHDMALLVVAPVHLGVGATQAYVRPPGARSFLAGSNADANHANPVDARVYIVDAVGDANSFGISVPGAGGTGGQVMPLLRVPLDPTQLNRWASGVSITAIAAGYFFLRWYP